MEKKFSFLLKADADEIFLPEQVRQWQVLQVFNAYRFCIALILLIFYFHNSRYLSFTQPWIVMLVISIIIIYFIFSLLSLYIAYQHWMSVNFQTIVQVIFDITIYSLLIWSNYHFIYGFGILINASIAGGSIITAGRISLLFAAYASIAVLVQNVFSDPHAFFATTGYAETGILGATFFATAILGYGLSLRVRLSEALASQRGIDLAKLEKVNALIIQRMRAGVIVIDENDRIRFMNDIAWYLLGVPHREGPQLIGNIAPELTLHLRNWQKNPTSTQTVAANQGLLIQFMPISSFSKENKFATLIFIDDATRLSQQAQQIKLASLGRLTASIAHEIRNPLSAISHAGQLLAESSVLTSKERRLTEIILKHSLRMNEVIENVLQLSRRKQAAPALLEVKPWLEDFVKYFKLHLNENPDISIYVEPENLTIYVDSSQLWQILTNLCENALHYSKACQNEKSIRIKAGITCNKEDPFIEVIDQGQGVAPDVLDYIFEPFFTTKPGGTGLGLYIAKELCEANRGHLSYSAIEQGGSCFRITFNSTMLMNANED